MGRKPKHPPLTLQDILNYIDDMKVQKDELEDKVKKDPSAAPELIIIMQQLLLWMEFIENNKDKLLQ